MKPSSFFALVLVVVVFVGGYLYITSTVEGSGNIITENRPMTDDFQTITMTVPAQLEIVQGETPSLTLVGDDNVIEQMETIVEGDDLKIRFKRRMFAFGWTFKATLHATVIVSDLEGVTVSGTVDVQADNVTFSHFDLTLDGSSAATMNIHSNNLTTTINGSGTVHYDGSVARHTIKINGSGKITARDMQTDATIINIRGSGSAEIDAYDSLDITIDGSGTVRYLGTPSITQSLSGTASIEQLAR